MPRTHCRCVNSGVGAAGAWSVWRRRGQALVTGCNCTLPEQPRGSQLHLHFYSCAAAVIDRPPAVQAYWAVSRTHNFWNCCLFLPSFVCLCLDPCSPLTQQQRTTASAESHLATAKAWVPHSGTAAYLSTGGCVRFHRLPLSSSGCIIHPSPTCLLLPVLLSNLHTRCTCVLPSRLPGRPVQCNYLYAPAIEDLPGQRTALASQCQGLRQELEIVPC